MKSIVTPSWLCVAFVLQAMACSGGADRSLPMDSGTPAAGGDGPGAGGDTVTGEGDDTPDSPDQPGSGGAGGVSDSPSTGGNGGLETGGRPSVGGGGGAQTGGAAGSGVGGSGVGGSSEPVKPQAICPSGPFEDNPIPLEPAVQQPCQDLPRGFSAGLAWLADPGVLYFSRSMDLVSYAPGGSCQTHIAQAWTRGLAAGPDGTLLGANRMAHTIESFDLVTKMRTEVVRDYMGKKLESPMDLTVSSKGHLYFTRSGNPEFEPPSFAPPGLYWLDPEGKLALVETGKFRMGITLSLDESRLLVVGDGEILSFKVDDTGKPSEPTPFIALRSDGMVLDCAGNLYVTQGNRVDVYDGAGQLKGGIDFGAGVTVTDVAFGGPDRKTLFATTSSGMLLSVQLNVPGLPY